MSAALICEPPTLLDGIFSFPTNWNSVTNAPASPKWDLFSGTDLPTFEDEVQNAGPKREVQKKTEPEVRSVPGTQKSKRVKQSRSFVQEDEEDSEEVEMAEEDEEEWTERSEHRRPGRSRRPSKRSAEGAVDGSRSARQAAKRRCAEGQAQTMSRGDVDSRPRSKTTLIWRKYGQKNLRGKQWRGIVRCYYKCHLSSCPAKKLVEKRAPDLDTIIAIKYESEHNHHIADEDLEEAGVLSGSHSEEGNQSDAGKDASANSDRESDSTLDY